MLIILIYYCCSNQKENEPSIVTKEVTYSTNGTTLKCFITYDESQKDVSPGVLIVHKWWGYNQYARKRTIMLAEHGYVALAVDMYGNGKQADHPEDAVKFALAVM